MANNRMYLQCAVCKEDKCICKYYPNTGWYLVGTESTDKFLEKHSHCSGEKMFGNEQFQLLFEGEDDPKRGILRVVSNVLAKAKQGGE